MKKSEKYEYMIYRIKYRDHATFENIDINNRDWFKPPILVTCGEKIYEDKEIIVLQSDRTENPEYPNKLADKNTCHIIVKSCIVSVEEGVI